MAAQRTVVFMTKELPFLEGYAGQSTDELLALRGRFRTDSLVLAFEQVLTEKATRLGVSSLTVEELTVLAVEALEREVNNGGFDQFFFNTPEFAEVIVKALQRIGCPITTAIAGDAIAADANPDEAARERALERCDERYYSSPENIEEALLSYIGEHRGSILLGN
jgi:hypothetical protein